MRRMRLLRLLQSRLLLRPRLLRLPSDVPLTNRRLKWSDKRPRRRPTRLPRSRRKEELPSHCSGALNLLHLLHLSRRRSRRVSSVCLESLRLLKLLLLLSRPPLLLPRRLLLLRSPSPLLLPQRRRSLLPEVSLVFSVEVRLLQRRPLPLRLL